MPTTQIAEKRIPIRLNGKVMTPYGPGLIQGRMSLADQGEKVLVRIKSENLTDAGERDRSRALGNGNIAILFAVAVRDVEVLDD